MAVGSESIEHRESGESAAQRLWRHAVPAPIFERVLAPLPEFRRQIEHARKPGALADLIFVASDKPCDAAELFAKLRWGGVAVVCRSNRWAMQSAARSLREIGFEIEYGPDYVRQGWLSLPLLSRRLYYMLARKVQLIPPGQVTERFTYQVQLAHYPTPAAELVVQKDVPSVESIVDRLHRKFPEAKADVLERRAKRFAEKIFPTFLTREAAILMILEEHLPAPYNVRVPRAINIEQDEQGLVRRLRMSFLRNGGRQISQMEFAHQSADLLRAIHDIAKVIHLDLRLDNFVITPDGVGFVDFGSAVREGENLGANPMVGGLFEELMHTSQIQRMLYQMSVSGQLTSDIILQSHHKADKAVDFFYLAVQFNCPHSNPDLVDLIEYDPHSEDATQLSRLTAEILRPKDPANPAYRSAKDILHGIERIQLGLDRK